jgi:uncharacterized protein YjbJ (UPF0337 family)
MNQPDATHRGAGNTLKEPSMNKDQVKGAVKDAAGTVQEKAGQMTGSTTTQAKGLAKQAEGTAQKQVGDVKEAAKDATRR